MGGGGISSSFDQHCISICFFLSTCYRFSFSSLINRELTGSPDFNTESQPYNLDPRFNISQPIRSTYGYFRTDTDRFTSTTS